MSAAELLPVEPNPSAMPSGQVPGSASAPTSALAYIRPASHGNIYADELRDLPVECWDPIANRRFVILRRRPTFADDSMSGFRARWLDEERIQNLTIRARSLVAVIGAFDIHNNADWVLKNVDPHYEDAKAERRQKRRPR